MIKELTKLFRLLLFPLEFYRCKSVVKQSNPLFSYPLMLDMECNKPEYRKRFVNGESMIDIIEQKMHNLINRLYKGLSKNMYKRKRRELMSREDYFELLRRYRRFQNFWEKENAFREVLIANGEEIPPFTAKTVKKKTGPKKRYRGVVLPEQYNMSSS